MQASLAGQGTDPFFFLGYFFRAEYWFCYTEMLLLLVGFKGVKHKKPKKYLLLPCELCLVA